MKRNTIQQQNNIIRIMNYVCTVFAVVLIVLQYLPFWGCFQCSTCGEGKVLSISEYVWFANDHADGLTSILANYYIPGFKAVDVVGTSVLIQIAGVLAVIFAVLRPTKCSTALLPLIAGLSCTLGYLSPAYQLGQKWQIHWIFGILTTVSAAAVFLVTFVMTYKRTKSAVLAELHQ